MGAAILSKVLSSAAGLMICCSVLLQAAVQAAEPILTLAMVGHDVMPAQRLLSRFSVESAPLPSVRPAEPGTPDILRADYFDSAISKPTVFLEKTPTPRRANIFLATGQYWTERGHSKLWSKLSAGYGQVFYDYSWVIYGRNGWEEPGCGYLKISLQF